MILDTSWIQTFSICLIPGSVWVQYTDCFTSLCFRENLVHFIDKQQCSGRAPFLLWEFSFRCLAHNSNMGFSPSVRSHHRGPHGNASLKANKHLSTSKQTPHAVNTNIHIPTVEPWSQRQKKRCNNSHFLKLNTSGIWYREARGIIKNFRNEGKQMKWWHWFQSLLEVGEAKEDGTVGAPASSHLHCPCTAVPVRIFLTGGGCL